MDRRSTAIIVVSVALMISLSMGLRQSLGLFMPALTRDLALPIADFTLAIALQNLAWGVFQPVAGGLAVRFGFRTVMMTGACLYIAGLLLLATASGLIQIIIGAGALIGIGMACTASAMAMAVASRAVSPARRSLTLGCISASGSAGVLYAAPIGQYLIESVDWQTAAFAFTALALLMLPTAWIAGRIDAEPLSRRNQAGGSAREALSIALTNPSFLVMAGAYFVCGMQLIFLLTHLPSYIEICGLSPMLAAQAIGLIGLFNIAGSLFFGWAGGRYNKQALLGMIYVTRSIVLAWYFLLPATPTTTLVFAAVMGFLWLGVGPLVAGSVAEMFGLKWQAMIQGVAFMNHQVGSFVGAFGGGWIFDAFGSYDLAWRLGVGLGLAAGTLQIAFAILRPPRGGEATA